jgi:hypothetical protein
MSGNVTPAPFPALSDRTAMLRQFATWPDSQRLRFLVDAVTVHANRGGTDTIYWAVVSPAPQRNRRSARRKPKGTDASRSA